MNKEKPIQSELNNSNSNSITVTENVALKRHRENLKKAQMNTLEYGEEIVLVGNSKKEELYDYLLGSIGTIIQRNRINNNINTTTYIVMFGDLKVDVDVQDIALTSDIEGL